jgi:hypothetical protein
MTDNAASDGPGTASAFPPAFRSAVTLALTEHDYRVAHWEAEGVNVVPPDGGNSPDERLQYIGLANLLRRARGTDETEWPAMVREFVTHLRGALDAPKVPDDLCTIAERLRPRLGRPFSREGQAYPWGIALPGTGLEINLVIDYPHTMAYVTEEMLARTDKPGEDLLDIALANLRSNTGEDFFERVSDELDIYLGHTGDGYDAARALLIEDLLPESAAGFWVAIPSREELAVWPVSFDALARIHVIKMFAQDNFRDHAYPVTDEVFWVWRGMWHTFGIRLEDDSVTISPPDEFVAALESLRKDGGDSTTGA